MSSQRGFYSVLEKINGNGRYQSWSLLFWCLVMLTAGSSTYFNPFLFYQEDYHCQIKQNCRKYVCALPQEQRNTFIQQSTSSMVSKFGDYRCDGQGELTQLQSFIYMGGIFGFTMGVVLSPLITNKKLIILIICVSLVGLVLTIFGPTLFIASVGLFINYGTKRMLMEIVTNFITEATTEEARSYYSIIIYVFFGLGTALNGLFFWWLPTWESALVVSNLIPILISLAGLIFYIQETPFDILTNSPPQESLSVLLRIAKRNGVPEEIHKLCVEQLAHLKEEYQQNEKKKHDYIISVIDLVRYDSLRLIFIISFIQHFLVAYQHAAPQLALTDYSMNIYINGAIIGFSDTLGSWLCFYFMHCERKKIINYSEALSLIIIIPIWLFWSCKGQEQCSQAISIIQTIGLFIFRTLLTFTYNFFILLQCEIFPNQIRSLALQATSIGSCIATILIPPIMAFMEKIGISVIVTFALFCILVIAFSFGLPETLGIPPPEMIEELKYEHYKFYKQRKQKNI